ncbi:MAG: hypothetical protein IPJ49_31195 [Candidatus Obscuribacter sp.]|nr:hypothetical protein [Candidatus Obscuribacter sp.]
MKEKFQEVVFKNVSFSGHDVAPYESGFLALRHHGIDCGLNNGLFAATADKYKHFFGLGEAVSGVFAAQTRKPRWFWLPSSYAMRPAHQRI